jgi:hypothetical protein
MQPGPTSFHAEAIALGETVAFSLRSQAAPGSGVAVRASNVDARWTNGVAGCSATSPVEVILRVSERKRRMAPLEGRSHPFTNPAASSSLRSLVRWHWSWIRATDRVQDQLHSAGYAQFVVDPQQVIADGVFAERQLWDGI